MYPYLYEAGAAVIGFIGLLTVSHKQIKKDSREVIDYKIAPLAVEISGLREQTRRIEAKLDKLLMK